MPASHAHGPSDSYCCLSFVDRHRRGARADADRRRSLPDRIAHLRTDVCHRGARLQSAARLHWPAVVRPFRLFRHRRLHRGVHRARSARPFHGAVHPRRIAEHVGDLGAVRLRVRAPHAHLLQHPCAGAVAGAVEPRFQVLLGDGRHGRHPRAAQPASRCWPVSWISRAPAPTRGSSTPTTTTCWSCS